MEEMSIVVEDGADGEEVEKCEDGAYHFVRGNSYKIVCTSTVHLFDQNDFAWSVPDGFSQSIEVIAVGF